MNLTLPEIDQPIRMRFTTPMTDEELLRFCAENELLRVERNADGELRLMSPTGTDGGNIELDIATELNNWARQDGRGRALGSNSGVKLPDTAVRAADAGWVSWERYNRSPGESGYRQFVPEFVIEVRSKSDSLPDAHAKMAEWMGYGVELGWLVDPQRKVVEVYRAGQEKPDVLESVTSAYGEGPVAGFVLELGKVWG
jgi:Uma2 family endonuclease